MKKWPKFSKLANTCLTLVAFTLAGKAFAAGTPSGPVYTNVSTTTMTITTTKGSGGAPATFTFERGTDNLSWPFSVTVPATANDGILNDAGLSPNSIYYYRAYAAGNATPSVATFKYTAPTVPGAPVYSNATGSTVDLSWTAPVSGATSYKIQQSTSPIFATFTTPFTGVTLTAKTVTGLTGNTTYYFRMVASSAVGTDAAVSDSGFGASGGAIATLPGKPGTPTFTNVTDTAMTASWTAPAGGATDYTLSMSSDGGTIYNDLTTTTALNFPVSGLTGNTSYMFIVVANNATGGSGPDSNVGTKVTLPAPALAPTFSSVGTSSLKVVPNPAVGGATSYNLTVSDDGTIYHSVTSAATVFPISVTGLAASNDYFFQLVPQNVSGNGTISPAASQLTAPDAPGQPVISNVLVNSLDLTWTAPVNAATSYAVLGSKDAGATYNSLTSGVTTLSTTLTNFSRNADYVFVITATNAGGGTSDQSLSSTSQLTYPGVPGVATFANVSATSMTINWTAPTGGADTYDLTRATNAAMTTNVFAVTTTAALSITNTGLVGNTTYYYSAKATNATGTGLSPTAGSQLTLPGVPGVPTFAAVSDVSMTVNWTAPAGGAASYTLSMSSDGGSTYSSVTTSATTYAVTGLTSSTTYTFKVQANNATGAGFYSATANQATTAHVWSFYLTNVSPTTATIGSDVALQLSLGTAGTGAVSFVKNAVTGPVTPPTAATQFTLSAGGQPVSWISGPLNAVALTSTGQVQFNFSAMEDSNSTNASLTAELLHLDGNGNTLGVIAAARVTTTEISNGSFSPQNWTVAMAATSIADADRIAVRIYIDDSNQSMNATTGGATPTQHTITVVVNDSSSVVKVIQDAPITIGVFAPTVTPTPAPPTATATAAPPTATAVVTNTATGTATNTPTVTPTFSNTPTATPIPSGNKIYLRDTASGVAVSGTALSFDGLLLPGSVPATDTVSTGGFNGPINAIQWTSLSGGSSVVWVSNQLEAMTINGNINFNFWASEANSGPKAGIAAKILHLDANGNELGEIVALATPVAELGTTTGLNAWSASPASTTITAGDRIAILLYVDDAPGLTIVKNKDCVLNFNAGGTSDSWVSFTENLMEFVPTATVTPTPTFTASNTPGAGTPTAVPTLVATNTPGPGTPTAVPTAVPTDTPVPGSTSTPAALVDGGGKTTDVVSPLHVGGTVSLYVYKQAVNVTVDVYALDNHKVLHADLGSGSGSMPAWTTVGVAPGVYYLKITVDLTDGTSNTEVKKVVLRP